MIGLRELVIPRRSPMLHAIPRGITGSMLAVVALVACADGTGPGSATARGDHTANACDHDVTAPVVTAIGVSPNTLWPPNHKLVPVTVALAATDACSAVTSAIASVTSDEPVNGLGDGNTEPDWVVTGALTLLLRAERSGLGDGRVYTIGVTSTDASGNATTSYATVLVPHDQGNGGDRKP
jgi:hypothetical protein